MDAQVNISVNDWQFHFAIWQWLWAPVVLMLLYIIFRNMAGITIRWKMPGFRLIDNQQYLHPQYELIKKLVNVKNSGTIRYFRWLRFILIWLVISLSFMAMAQPE